MAIQAGNIMLWKDGTGTAAAKIAAMQTVSFNVNGEKVDVTNIDSAGYQELLAGAGIASVQVSVKGVISDAVIFGSLLNRSIARSLDQYTLSWGSTKTMTAAGGWQLTKFGGAGAYNKEQNYDITLESSGSLTTA